MGSPESELNMNKKESNTQGFTLIELLITILILSTIAGIVAINITSAANKQYRDACKIDAQSISSANASYQNDSNKVATSLQELLGKGYLVDAFTTVIVGNVLSRKGSPFKLSLGPDGKVIVEKAGVSQGEGVQCS